MVVRKERALTLDARESKIVRFDVNTTELSPSEHDATIAGANESESATFGVVAANDSSDS